MWKRQRDMSDDLNLYIYVNIVLKIIGVTFIIDMVQLQNFREVILSYFPMEKEVYYIIQGDLSSHR